MRRTFGDVERLADVLERARAHRLDRRFERAEAADEHDGRIGMLRAKRAQQIDPDCGALRLMSEMRRSKDSLRILAYGLVRVLRGRELPSRFRQKFLQEPACFAIVVDDEYARHDRVQACVGPAAPARGRSIVKTAPPSGALRADAMPPCARTTSRTIPRPMPVPCPAGFVVTHGSKIRSTRLGRNTAAGISDIEPETLIHCRRLES